MGEQQNQNCEIYVEIDGEKYKIGEIGELETNYKKPPLGITPKWFWDKLRMAEIEAAIIRYIEAKKRIPTEWLEELLGLRLEEDRCTSRQSVT